MSKFVDYSSKASAVRGLTRHLGVAARNNPDLDLNALISQRDGRWGFDPEAADRAVGINNPEDEELVLACGHSHCPNCGVHLSNGLMDFDALSDQMGGDAKAYKEQKHQWSCMGCNHEWGAEIVLKGADKPTKTGRKYPNRNYSDVEKPSEIVFRLADEMKDAKRKEVVEAAIALGVTPNTARAAYQHWRKARGLSKA